MGAPSPPTAPAEDAALAERVRAADRDRFEAALFAPPPLRGELLALYAFNLEAARLPWVSVEAQICAIRLRWLLDRVAEAYDGAGDGDTQPVGEAVGPFLALIRARPAGARPPRAAVEGLIEARAREVDPAPIGPHGAAELDAFLEATGGGVTRLAAYLCLGSETERTRGAALDLGYANGAARLLEATGPLAARGRVMVPCPLADAGRALGGEMSDSLRAGAAALAERAMARLERARRIRSELPGPMLPALLAGWRTRRVLVRALRPGADLFRDLGPESEFRRRASLLGRAALGRW